jgi:hypothetical protein
MEDSRLVGAGEVSSIPEELLLGQGRILLYRTSFYGRGKGWGSVEEGKMVSVLYRPNK